MLTKIRNSLIAQGDIQSSDFKTIERACNLFSDEASTLDLPFRLFATNVKDVLIKQLGFPKNEIETEKKIMGIYAIDLVHKDFAFEINGPFHYIHDPIYNTDPNFSI